MRLSHFVPFAGPAKKPAITEPPEAIGLFDVVPEERSYDGGSESEGDIPRTERPTYKTSRLGMRLWLLPWCARSRKGSFLGRLLRHVFLGLIFVL
jgi:hypothetical protein